MDEENILEMDYTFNDRLGPCEVCGSEESKYTCPRCEVKTCSLPCVKVHKKELECNGIRDRTKFVHLKRFSNLDMLSDYRLLEEVTRSVEAAKRDHSHQYSKHVKEDLPIRLHRLRSAANRREMLLKFLPKHFTRHKNNTSYVDFKNQIISWKVEWIFLNADNFKCVDDKCIETEKIGSLLNKYFDIKTSDASLKEKLQFYQSVGMSGVKIFLKAEQKKGKKFYELDSSTTLQDALRFKIIIENPTIHVVLKEHSYSYDVINPDEEYAQIEEEEHKQNFAALRLENIKREREKRKKRKNLLFVTGYSDDEPSSSNGDSSDSDIKVSRVV